MTEEMRDLISEIDDGELRQTILKFSRLNRYTGSRDGEEAVDYLMRKLHSYGIPCHTEEFEFLRSYPVITRLTVNTEGREEPIEAMAAVFSGNCDNLTGEVWYEEDHLSGKTEKEEARRRTLYQDKIVLTHRRHGEDVLAAFFAGAKAVISIWNSPEDLLHHNMVGTVWGGPTPEKLYRYSHIPAVCIKQKDGRKLAEICRSGKKVTARLTIQMAEKVVKARMPIADIPGERDTFLLVNGHYDSWYEGITDNAAANAAQLECARILWNHRDRLTRSVRFAWWGGHSDGRYAGSTAYADRHWEELEEKCIGQINQDMFAGHNCQLVCKTTGCMEKTDMLREWIEDTCGAFGRLYENLYRSADESFSGIGLPISMMSTFIPREDSEWMPHWPEAAGPWWHTVEDSLDKLNEEYLHRDTAVTLRLAAEFTFCRDLPVDMPGFVGRMMDCLGKVQEQTEDEFDLRDAIGRLSDLQKALIPLQEKLEKGELRDSDPMVKHFAGRLMRLAYSYGSEYDHDPAYAGETMFSRFCQMKGLTRENSRPVWYLAVKNQFVRQKNRLMDQTCRLLREAQNFER